MRQCPMSVHSEDAFSFSYYLATDIWHKLLYNNNNNNNNIFNIKYVSSGCPDSIIEL